MKTTKNVARTTPTNQHGKRKSMKTIKNVARTIPTNFYGGKEVTPHDSRFIETLRRQLRKSGMTMAEASRKAGATESYLKKILSYHSRPSYLMALALMDVLGFSEGQRRQHNRYVASLPLRVSERVRRAVAS